MGKRGGEHSLPQEEINRLVIERARRGQVVVRLKGGDPFIFGRGGEEAEALHEAGIAFEVVPGVTSAIAVPAYSGIPLTHRELASTVAFVTGHPAEEVSGIDWRALAGIATVVFLMGTKRLPEIVAALVKHGRHRRRRSRSSGPVAGPSRRPSRGACATSWRRLRGYAHPPLSSWGRS